MKMPPRVVMSPSIQGASCTALLYHATARRAFARLTSGSCLGQIMMLLRAPASTDAQRTGGRFPGAAEEPRATAAVSLATSSPVRAAAPPAGTQAPGWYRYKVGSFEMTVVTDGVPLLVSPQRSVK